MIEFFSYLREKYSIYKKSIKKICNNSFFLYNTLAFRGNGILAQ